MKQKTMEQDYEKKLVKKANSSMSAFGELYDFYLPKIYKFIFRRVGRKEDAEDLTALTFERALSGLKKFRWQGIPFGAWLYRIANNNINDFYRKKHGITEVDIENVSMKLTNKDKEIESVENKINFEYLRSALYKLSPESQEIISLKFFEELSNDEIAKIIGCSKNNLAVKIYRGLKALKIILENSKREGEYV